MKFSIITPYLPPRTTLARCIESIDNQTYTNWEHIVMIDDPAVTIGSTDNRKFITCDTNHGYVGHFCRNLAWEHASGDVIMYLDDDDYYLDNCLEKVNNALTLSIGFKWGYFALMRKGERFFHYPPEYGKIGTSQLFHRRDYARWLASTSYAADWEFARDLYGRSEPLLIDEILGVIPEQNWGSKEI